MRRRGNIATTVALAALAAPTSARAYRPFDQTDADVAETHAIELELGPVSYIQQSSGGTYAPGFVLNYGAARRVELVLDAHDSFLFGGPQIEARRRQLETGVLAKGVLREGSLQGARGVSVAAEAGALLPTLPATGGVGASLAVIASQRWQAATVHLNVEGDLTRTQSFAFVAGGIVEGPYAWAVRPVSELLVARQDGASPTLSALLGAIWRARDGVVVDAAARGADQAGAGLFELRAGVTLSW